MIKDYLKFSFNGIKNRKLRSWLTMIGIFIGITAVVSLISISQGLQDSIKYQFEKMGTDKIIIYPGGSSEMRGAFMSGFSESKLTEDDVKTIKRVKEIDLVAGMIAKSTNVEFKGQKKFTFVSGIPVDETKEIIEDIQQYEIVKGRDLEKGDDNKVVIGYMVANGDIFDKKVDVRDKLIINEKSYRVIGTLKKIGSAQGDTSVIVTLDAAKKIFGDDDYAAIIAKVKKGVIPGDVVDDVKKELRKSRDEKEGKETFSVQTFEQLLESFNVILNVVQVVLIAIASISLLVGGVGIMNTMYTSVLERTREIGIMKAIGAKNSDILQIFLIEAGIYGLIGGAIGVLFGIGISKAAEAAASYALGSEMFAASIPWWLIFGALAFSTFIGIISGVAPAKQASSLKPVDALRYE